MFLRLLIFTLLLTMTAFSQIPPIETGVAQTLARWRAANYSDVRYKLSVTLEKQAPLMKGELEIRVTLTNEGAKNDLILDWRTTQFANDKDKPYANVVAVNNAIDVISTVSKEHLIVPKGALQTGANVIKIQFASPVKTSGAAITRYVDKEDGAEYVYSLFVPSDASTAFPVFDQPDLKARFQLNVIAPKEWKVVSNSSKARERLPAFRDAAEKFKIEKQKREAELERQGAASFEFEPTKQISTYVFAFAAGNFDVFFENSDNKSNVVEIPVDTPFDRESSGNHIYVRKSQAEKFKAHEKEIFRLNREAVKYLESYFDFQFPFPKYDLILIPEFPFNGMEHAGATFIRESSIIFPSEPTKNDFISRANVIFHEAAHQWFGDTVTMKWFDDLWLKEGFAEFMAYKTLEKVLPEYNAWKAFYERNKPLAYLTDSTRGTTPIYQPIPNLSAAKSAYGNIVYRKAPSFLRQAEFFLGEDKFQTAVRAFLQKYQFKNAEWKDLVREFAEIKVADIKKEEFYQKLSPNDKTTLEDFTRWSIEKEWAEFWVEKRGAAVYRITPRIFEDDNPNWQMTFAPHGAHTEMNELFSQETTLKDENYNWLQDVKILKVFKDGQRKEETRRIGYRKYAALPDAERKQLEERKKKNQEQGRKFEIEKEQEQFEETEESRKLFEEALRKRREASKILYVFPNYQDYGYGIFLLDEKSRAYVLGNIQNETDDFLRSMMWGTLWDSVREAELSPKDYVELAVKNISIEKDELTIQTILSRVSTAMNYYLSDAQCAELAPQIENLLIEKMRNAPTPGQRITFYRAFLNVASSENARNVLKEIQNSKFKIQNFNLKTKDKFDIVTKLAILGDADAPKLLADLVKTETSDDAKRYAYAANAGFAGAENKAKFYSDFTTNKEISESWIEAAFAPFNAVRHSELTLPFLEKALAELPNLKRSRKIFFVNGWLGAFIGGQKDEKALAVVNKFLAENTNLDKDLRLKILENVDGLERAVKIRAKYGETVVSGK